MIYLISDTHFNHYNIIKYCNRPFKNVHEMNMYMIEKWNETVQPTDTIYHLGDYAFGDKKFMQDVCNKLNGYKILIRGNHDKKGNNFFLDIGFNEVHKSKTINNYILTHRPLLSVPQDFINIHGHIHNVPLNNEFNKMNHINVSTEVLNYIPININDIHNLTVK